MTTKVKSMPIVMPMQSTTNDAVSATDAVKIGLISSSKVWHPI